MSRSLFFWLFFVSFLASCDRSSLRDEDPFERSDSATPLVNEAPTAITVNEGETLVIEAPIGESLLDDLDGTADDNIIDGNTGDTDSDNGGAVDAPVVEEEPIPFEVNVEEEVKKLRHSRYDVTWDHHFEEWTKFYLPFHSFTLLKAQCYQESLLNPIAMSHVGAKGLCQFMDFTWKDVSQPLKFPPEANAYDPELSIQAAAYYDAKLRRGWKAPRPEEDRMNLTFASYNAGMGHLINAQKACGGKNLYNDIIECLPQITGRHSKETITYVERIRKWETVMNLEF